MDADDLDGFVGGRCHYGVGEAAHLEHGGGAGAPKRVEFSGIVRRRGVDREVAVGVDVNELDYADGLLDGAVAARGHEGPGRAVGGGGVARLDHIDGGYIGQVEAVDLV